MISTNITYDTAISISSTRDTVLLYIETLPSGVEDGMLFVEKTTDVHKDDEGKYSVIKDGESETTTLTITDSDFIRYLDTYFLNGGNKLLIKKGTIPTNVTSLKTLSTNYIVLVQYDTNGGFSSSKYANIDTLTGVFRKIIVGRSSKQIATDELGCCAVKVSNLVGAEMSIAAYLSQIDVYDSGKVNDYANTIETMFDDESVTIDVSEDTSLISIPYNFDMYIANEWCNLGGNLTNGESLVVEYILIIMQQTLTNALYRTLRAKVKGQSGVSALRTAMCAELNKYTSSGFLVTDRVWEKDDLTLSNPLDKTASKETIISKNTPISSGYYIHMFKLTNNRREVYSYIILTTNAGIRYVRVDGRVMA